MSNTSLLFYSLKESSIKTIVLDLLSLKWPLSINEIHKTIISKNKLKISYQAVHKAVKELLRSGCLINDKNNYKINLEWLREVNAKMQQIEANYQGEFLFPKTIIREKGEVVNILVAKEGIIRDVFREERLYSVLKELLKVYKQEFPIHNIFHRTESEAIEYLLETQKKNELVIYTYNNKVMGGVFLDKKASSLKDGHMVWKLKHFVVDKNCPLNVEISFFDEIKKRLLKKSHSVKIIVHLSDKEDYLINLFKKYHFKKEGVLKDYYRAGESTYIYSFFLTNKK